jgi:hypothetical protein
MKLSQWAKKLGISYKTAWRMYQNGQIPNAGVKIMLCLNKIIRRNGNG